MTSTSDLLSTSADSALEQLHRSQWGRLLSLLVGRTRRLDLAEDALGEAFVRAAERWPDEGAPTNPAGWLYATSHRLILDRLRAEAMAGRKAPLIAARAGWEPSPEIHDQLADDRLHLVLLCCHPALPPEARSALALRLVVGTPTEQIARLFLVPRATMAARLTRAKKKIVVAGIPLAAPVGEELRLRLDEVCRTVYLAFTAGYAPGAGPDLLRADLAGEAVRLAAALYELAPEAAQVSALLGLLLLQHSRRDARSRAGRLVTLAEQDRGLWRHDEIRAGLLLVGRLRPSEGYAEDLRLQALIAAEHAGAATAEQTNWVAIAGHYEALAAQTSSAVVRLNRAVAVAEVRGPRAGLSLLEGLDDVLADGHRLAAVRGELAQRLGDVDLARKSYAAALERCGNDVERAHLHARLAGLR